MLGAEISIFIIEHNATSVNLHRKLFLMSSLKGDGVYQVVGAGVRGYEVGPARFRYAVFLCVSRPVHNMTDSSSFFSRPITYCLIVNL